MIYELSDVNMCKLHDELIDEGVSPISVESANGIVTIVFEEGVNTLTIASVIGTHTLEAECSDTIFNNIIDNKTVEDILLMCDEASPRKKDMMLVMLDKHLEVYHIKKDYHLTVLNTELPQIEIDRYKKLLSIKYELLEI
jgi:hypothetical protein